MAMTREQVLAEMESSFAEMTEEEQNEVLFNDLGRDWSPVALLAEVRNDTEIGQNYVKSWSDNKEKNSLLESLLASLLGGRGVDGLMTCGDPDCPNCKGEVRPFDELPGTGTDGDPTLH
jgi:hypothetical protein